MTGTPTGEGAASRRPAELGIDLGLLAWERSGDGDGSIEIAFPLSAGWTRGDWVLMRVVGDQDRRVLVFDRNEWVCFLDGVQERGVRSRGPAGHGASRPA